MLRKSPPLPPEHPGEILREDLMSPLGLSISLALRGALWQRRHRRGGLSLCGDHDQLRRATRFWMK
jgi:hypothetical protein